MFPSLVPAAGAAVAAMPLRGAAGLASSILRADEPAYGDTLAHGLPGVTSRLIRGVRLAVVVVTRLGAPRGMPSVVRLRVMTRPCRAVGLLDVASVVVLTRLGAPRAMTSAVRLRVMVV